MINPGTSPPPRPSSRQLSDVLDRVADELKCAICLDNFVEPVFLPCHHTYCRGCVASLVQSEDTHGRIVTCPLCRTDCGVPEDGEFPINFQIRNLVERIKPLGSFQKCGLCRKVAAAIYCFKCSLFLCDRCDEDVPAHDDAGDDDEDANSAGFLTVSSDGSSSVGVSVNHVRVPVLDALAILQLRRADQQLDAGTLGAQWIPPQLTKKQCYEHVRGWLGSSWLPRGSGGGVKFVKATLTFVPHWAWRAETRATGSAFPNASSDGRTRTHSVPTVMALSAAQQARPPGAGRGSLLSWVSPPVAAASSMPHTPATGETRIYSSSSNVPSPSVQCELRTCHKPVLVCATTELSATAMSRIEPWDFKAVERLPDVAPSHETARLACADITQRDTWPEAESRVELEASVELDRELRRRAGAKGNNLSANVAVSEFDIVITSKTVRRLWLPVWECTYILNQAEGEPSYTVVVNAQTGRCWGERPAVNSSRLLGAMGIGLAAVLTPFAAYQLAKKGPW